MPSESIPLGAWGQTTLAVAGGLQSPEPFDGITAVPLCCRCLPASVSLGLCFFLSTWKEWNQTGMCTWAASIPSVHVLVCLCNGGTERPGRAKRMNG